MTKSMIEFEIFITIIQSDSFIHLLSISNIQYFLIEMQPFNRWFIEIDNRKCQSSNIFINLIDVLNIKNDVVWNVLDF